MTGHPDSEQDTLPVYKPLPLYQQPAVVLLFFALLAITADRLWQPARIYWLALIGLSILMIRTQSFRLKAVFAACFLIGCVGYWHATSQRYYPPNHLNQWLSSEWKPVVLRGTLASQIEHRRNELAALRPDSVSPWQAYVDIEIEEVRVGSQWQAASGNARLIVKDRLDTLLFGDRVLVACAATKPSAPRNPGEPDFRQSYHSIRQLALLSADNAECVQLEKPGRWGLWRLTAWLAKRGEFSLERNVGDQHGSLASAIVLGRRGAIPEELRTQMVATGTVHLSVVSGLHVGIVAYLVTWIVNAIGYPMKTRFIIVFLSCCFYAIMTGLQPPVVRATALVGIVLLGRYSGRRGEGFNLLAVATLILLLFNPMWLNLIGTQLSLLAVIGVLISGEWTGLSFKLDPLDRLIAASDPPWFRLLKRFGIQSLQSLKVSLCVWATTTPLLWFYFHIISWISLFANLLMGPFLFISLLFGLATAILGGLWLPLGIPTGWLCAVSLWCIETLASLFSELPLSHSWLPSPPFAMVVAFYGMLLLVLVVKPVEYLPWVGAVSLLWTATAMLEVMLRQKPPAQLTVTFVDVGHGTSVLLQPARGLPWLYDAGKLGVPAQSARPIEAVLWHAGIRRLGGMVLSHADSDHYSAVPQLLERFKCDRIIVPPGMFDKAPPLLQEVESAIRRRGVPLFEVAANEAIPGLPADMHSQVLHPPREFRKKNDNSASLVWSLEQDGLRVILPGDLEQPGTNCVLRYPRPNSHGLMMAPHHGAISQDPLPLLEWARPNVIVVSGGKQALRPAVVQRLESVSGQIWITARDGAVRVQRIDGEIRAQGFLQQPW